MSDADSSAQSASRPPVRLLVVDDELSYTKLLTKRMTHRGFEVTAVNSGREAVQAMRCGSYDVALLDLKMEDIDGLETLKMLKILAPETKVIILTGHGGEAEARRCFDLGAFDYLVKPCRLEVIIQTILRAVGRF
ncbi:MAG: response regulator [Deltaproteobacteria bacterium]|nr:response regulator [Deltaproteobacteria bacterium]